MVLCLTNITCMTFKIQTQNQRSTPAIKQNILDRGLTPEMGEATAKLPFFS